MNEFLVRITGKPFRALLSRGESYKCNREFRRSLDILKYALQLQNSGGGMLTYLYLENFEDLCCLFRKMYKESRQSIPSVDQLILSKESFEVLEMVTTKLELTVGNKHAEKHSNLETEISDFMNCILLFIKVITDLNTNAYQVCSFRKIVHRLVSCQPRTIHGQTLLHLSISPNSNDIVHIQSKLKFPCIAVVELLLECGANVNAVDEDINTALHFCSQALRDIDTKKHPDLIKRIAGLLLKNGAHVDMVNIWGDRAVDNLLSSLMEMNMLDFISLKCLSASVVMKYKISYAGHIPASLESFVQMHCTHTPDYVSDSDSDSDAVSS